MSVPEVMEAAAVWQFCWGRPDPKPAQEARITLKANSLEVSGLGEKDGTTRYGSQRELAAALSDLIQAHGTKWVITFGYVVVPRRQYVDVMFDEKARVFAVSEVRQGGPD